VRVYRGADIGSDHYMVVAAIKVKLKSLAKRMKHTVLDTAKLKNKRTKEQFRLELNNRFSVLEQQEDNEQNVEEDWKEIKDTIINIAKDEIGFRRGSKKVIWTTETTWTAIDERRSLKAKKEQAFKTAINIEQCIEDYKVKDKEVKSKCTVDRDIWFEDKVVEAEKAAYKGDSKTLYIIVKELSGRLTQKIPINDVVLNY